MFRNTMIAGLAALVLSLSAYANGGGNYQYGYGGAGASGSASAGSVSYNAASSVNNGAAFSVGGAHQTSTVGVTANGNRYGVKVGGEVSTEGGAGQLSGAIGNASAGGFSASEGSASFGGGGGFENGYKYRHWWHYHTVPTSQGSASAGAAVEGGSYAETGAAYIGLAGAHATNEAHGGALAGVRLTRNGGIKTKALSGVGVETSAHDFDIGIAYGASGSYAGGEAGAEADGWRSVSD